MHYDSYTSKNHLYMNFGPSHLAHFEFHLGYESRSSQGTKLSEDLPAILFQWVHKDSAEAKQRLQSKYMPVPVYLTPQRNILVTSQLKLDGGGNTANWQQRGVAMMLWNK
jgi:hypothetical protein